MSNTEEKSVVGKIFRGVIGTLIIVAFLAAMFLNAYDVKTKGFTFSDSNITLLFWLAVSIVISFFKGSSVIFNAVLARLGIVPPPTPSTKNTKNEQL